MPAKDDMLHPAADVFRNQLLIDVGDENLRLEDEIESKEGCRQFLGSVELHLAGGKTVPVSFRFSFVINDYSGLPTQCVPIRYPSSYPLSEFGSGEVTMAGQPIGTFPGAEAPFVGSINTRPKTVDVKFVFSMGGVLEGEIGGLHPEDFADFVKDPDIAEERLMTFLSSGQGLRCPNEVTFTPQILFMVMGDNLEESLRVLELLTRRIASLEDKTPLPEDPSHRLELPPPSPAHAFHVATLEALGFTTTQMKVLAENCDLQNRLFCVQKIEERIASIELYNMGMKSRPLSLRDGQVIKNPDGSLSWSVCLQLDGDFLSYCPVLADALELLQMSVSGVLSQVESYQIRSDDGEFVASFHAGFKVTGVLESAEAFDRMIKPIAQACGGSLPPGLALATKIDFPLDSIRRTLDVLEVDYSDGCSEEEGKNSKVDVDKATGMLQALQF